MEASINIANAVKASDRVQNPLVALITEGQSVWLDNLTRKIVHGTELKQLIEEDGLRGMTSNPTIFQKAIVGSSDYDDSLKALAGGTKTGFEKFESIAVGDVQAA